MNEFAGLSDLLEVQEVDSVLDRLRAEREGMPQLAEHAAAEAEAAEAAAARKLADDHLGDVDREVRRVEDELQTAEQTLKEREDRLYAGGTSAREADNMRMEVENLGRQKTALEDELLELLEVREVAAVEAGAAGRTAEEAERAERAAAEAVAGLRAEIDVKLAAQQSRRNEAVPAVPADLLELYEELRERQGGVVAGLLTGRSCGACHIEMSVAEYEEVLEDFPPRCIHCRAIVVP